LSVSKRQQAIFFKRPTFKAATLNQNQVLQRIELLCENEELEDATCHFAVDLLDLLMKPLRPLGLNCSTSRISLHSLIEAMQK
jgi:hypothetical protein